MLDVASWREGGGRSNMQQSSQDSPVISNGSSPPNSAQSDNNGQQSSSNETSPQPVPQHPQPPGGVMGIPPGMPSGPGQPPPRGPPPMGPGGPMMPPQYRPGMMPPFVSYSGFIFFILVKCNYKFNKIEFFKYSISGWLMFVMCWFSDVQRVWAVSTSQFSRNETTASRRFSIFSRSEVINSRILGLLWRYMV